MNHMYILEMVWKNLDGVIPIVWEPVMVLYLLVLGFLWFSLQGKCSLVQDSMSESMCSRQTFR